MTYPGFDILYHHGDCLAVNKPPGVLTQAPPGIDSLEARLRAFLRQSPPHEERPYLGLPHRLDRPVSGVMVFGATRKAARKLSRQFEFRKVVKTYWACLEGRLDSPRGVWEDHLRKVPDVARAEITTANQPHARQALLQYQVLGRTSHGDWIEVRLITGRMHQVRVQAASRGAPIVGDVEYGATTPIELDDDGRPRVIALHARRLEFRDPATQEEVVVTAPPPSCWDALPREVS